MDFDNSDEEWLEAVNADLERRNNNDPGEKRPYWTIRRCYNLRKAFLPEGVELENEAYYKSIYYGCSNFTRVNEYQKKHPTNNIYECTKELKMSLETVKKYWDEEVSASGYVKGGRKKAYKVARIVNWRKENPDGSVEQCSDALGYSIPFVYKEWDNMANMSEEIINELLSHNECAPVIGSTQKLTRSAAIVFLWKNEHPDGTIRQCASEKALSVSTVKKFWNETYDMDEAKKLINKKSKKRAPKFAKVVADWCQAHPEGKPDECMKELGISRSIVYDYWPRAFA